MDSNSNVKSSEVCPLIAKRLNSNVKSDLPQNPLLAEVVSVATARRARNIRQKAVADNVLNLLQVEAQPYEEHSMFDSCSIRYALTNMFLDTSDLYSAHRDQIACEIEKIVLLWGALREQGSWTGVAATVSLYVHTHFKGTLLGVIKDVFEDYFSTYQEHSVGAKSWMQSLKDTHANWKMATSNDGFQHVSRLLSTLIGAGLIQATALQCEVSGIKVFSDLCVPKFVSAFDLLDAAMNCVIFFVEGGYECIQSGSITPLLFGEKDFTRFDENFLNCCKYYDYAKPGNYALIETDDNAVFKLIEDTITEGKRLSQITKNPFSKKMVMERVTKLQGMEAYLHQHRLSAGTRVKPFCVCIYGGTGVGKTTMSPLVMWHILHPNGYDCSEKSIISLQAGAKHQDKIRTYMTGASFDDFGQVHPDFVQESPCEDFRTVNNTAKSTARMAALELKDKVSYEFKAITVSTNMKDLNAPAYSLEPASVTRRVDVMLTMKVRPEFATNGMLDSAKVEAHYNGDVPIVCDCWTFDMEVSYPVPNPTPGRHDTIGWKTIVWNGKPMVNVDIFEVLRYISLESKDHFARQKRMVEKTSNLDGKISVCASCNSSKETCVCGMGHTVTHQDHKLRPATVVKSKAPPLTPQEAAVFRKEAAFEDDCNANPKYLKEPRDRTFHYKSKFNQDRRRKTSNTKIAEPTRAVMPPLEEHSTITDALFDYVEYLNVLMRFRFDYIVPERFSRSHVILRSVSFFLDHPWAKFHAFGLVMVPLFVRSLTDLCIIYFIYLYIMYVLFVSYVDTLTLYVSHQRQAYWLTARHVADTTAKILGSGVAIALIYKAVKSYRGLRRATRAFEEHGYMEPSDEEIREIDANDVTEQVAREHNWANVVVSPLPASEPSTTITQEDLGRLVDNNTAVLVKNGVPLTCLLFIKSNVAVLATHLAVKLKDELYHVIRSDPTSLGGNFKAHLSFQHTAQIPNTDVSVVYVPSGGSWKDISKYFALEVYRESGFGVRLSTRDIGGTITTHQSWAVSKFQQLTRCRAFGYDYAIKSYVGMCGAALIAQKKAPMIVGIHVAGVVAQEKGFASAITQSDLHYALEELEARPGVLLANSEGTLKPVIFGKKMLEEQAVHAKSPVNFLEVDDVAPNIKVYGSCFGRATYHSKVVPSILSDHVHQVCGIAQQWGKPAFHKGKAWIDTLKYSSKPCVGMPPSLVDLAVVDYLGPLYKLLNDRPGLRSEVRPMTEMEVVCGKDGKKFIRKMDPNTAIGPPETGKKVTRMTYLDPADFEGFACPAELDQVYWTEYYEAEEIWDSGLRYHATFKGFLKDEPTPLTKDKVRIVQGAPIILQIGVRKYFLPIARILSLFPRISECAVGLNCMGPEWEDFQAHIKQHGTDRILAGDYSKYDLRLPAQLTLAAFKILIAIAKHCGYSDSALRIMRGIATDICYPTVAFNGDLLQFVGINPSGQNLTVYINGLASSIALRCAYFDIVPKSKHIPFREVCALGTYGDDVKSSVKHGYDEFNHVSVADFLARHDMAFTMPDKTSTPVPYMTDEEADFLKRRNIYIPELEQHVGALDEMSIFKSLHANIKSKALTPRELSADCINGALREWFFHGRDTYEKRQQEMERVAALAGIDHLCPMLSVPFDHQVARWRHRYLKEPLPAGVDENGNTTELWDDDDINPLFHDDPYEEHSVIPDCGSEMIPSAVDMYSMCNGAVGVSKFWWETPLISVLGIPFCIYWIYLWVIGNIKFNPTVWNYSHYVVLYNLLILGGPHWFFFNHIWPPIFVWLSVLFYGHVYYYG